MEAPNGRRCPNPCLAAALLLAALVLLIRKQIPGHAPGSGIATSSGAPPAVAACRHWATAAVLPGGCLGTMPVGMPFSCCSGREYACTNCSQPLLAHLHCASPRHMLLRPPPGCGLPPLPPPPHMWQAGSSCGLPSAAVWDGLWSAATPTQAAATPALPGAIFQLVAPGGGGSSSGANGSSSSGGGGSAEAPASPSCGGRDPTAACASPPCLAARGAAEVVPRCLWAAGFDRVLVSGDSSVRHLFNRLVSLLRQQGATLDGGGMQHAHYAQQVWRSGGGGGGGNGGGGHSSSGGSNSSSGGDGGGSYFVTDELWYSPSGEWLCKDAGFHAHT